MGLAFGTLVFPALKCRAIIERPYGTQYGIPFGHFACNPMLDSKWQKVLSIDAC